MNKLWICAVCCVLLFFSGCRKVTQQKVSEIKNGQFKVMVRFREFNHSGIENVDICVANAASQQFPDARLQCFLNGFDFTDLSVKWEGPHVVKVAFRSGRVTRFTNSAFVYPGGPVPVEFHALLCDGCEPVPVVVLEATLLHHGMGQEAKRLLVRLTEDDKIEWDEWKAFPASGRHTGSVSANVVSEVQRALNTVDQRLFRSQLGPYYLYIDTSDELQVRMKTKTGPVEFRLINPWSSGMPQKPMPTDVRFVFCEIDTLYARSANDAVDKACITNDSPR